MRLIGLTGRSGCGKTTVGAVAKSMGIPVLDCDQIYHELTSTPSACLREIADTFGTQTVQNGALYRPALREIVFSDPDALQKLNAITARHMRPEIVSRLKAIHEPIAILDAPTLFQSGMDEICDVLLCVIAADESCIGRIMSRDGIDRAAAENRLANQFANEYFIEHCDVVLYNEDDCDAFVGDVTDLLNALRKGEI